IWLEFMQKGLLGMPVENFPNVTPLEKLAPLQHVQVDVPDTAPPADVTEQGLAEPAAPKSSPPKPPEKPAASAPSSIAKPSSTASAGNSAVPASPFKPN
ncbi:MAG: hypothetical protein ACRD41_11920, partial [Candidatus Acidiferrales bacterium]